MPGEKSPERPKDIFLRASVEELAEAGIDERALKILIRLSLRENEERRRRQAKGIAAAKANGVQFGRPKAELPEDFGRIVARLESKRLTLDKALQMCGVSESTFFRRLRQYRQSLKETN